MASSVLFDPAPAITGTLFFTTSTHNSTTRLCSSCDNVGDSPVVPTGTRPFVPFSICQLMCLTKLSSSKEPS